MKVNVISLLRHVFVSTLPAAMVLLAAVAYAPFSYASPVEVYECNILFPGSPSPIEFVDTRFTIRRHVEQTTPFQVIETEFWSQSKFNNNGYFELTVYPWEGPPVVEKSITVQSTVQDGYGVVQDALLDEALTMEKTISYDGYTLDSIAIAVQKADGSQITDHLTVPAIKDRTLWDPYGGCGLAGCPTECVVTWRAPGEGVPCAIGGSAGGGLCTTGSYFGVITSITEEPHKAAHGSDFVINAGLNDAWVNPAAPYQGLFVTVYPDLGIVFVAWFTFDKQIPAEPPVAQFGAFDQRWVTAVGVSDGNTVSMKAEMTSGGRFNDDEPLPEQDTEYGTLDLEFSDCSNGKITYNFPGIGESGEFQIERVVADNVSLCEALSAP